MRPPVMFAQMTPDRRRRFPSRYSLGMVASFTSLLARRLLAWSVASVLVGIALLVLADDFWRGFGLQAALWGLIDAIIALVALRSGRREAERAAAGAVVGGPREDPTAGDAGAAGDLDAARRIARILWINAALDVVYVAIGAILVIVAGASDPFLAGNGWGVIVQGGFLLAFDVVHARRVPRPAATIPDAA
jgi:hypothetical protein